MTDELERPRVLKTEVRSPEYELRWKNISGGDNNDEIFVRDSNKVRYRQWQLRCTFNEPFASRKVIKGPRYDPLSLLCLPFIRKGAGRKDVGGDLDGDSAAPYSLDSPLLSPFRRPTRRKDGDAVILEGQNLTMFVGPPASNTIDASRDRHCC